MIKGGHYPGSCECLETLGLVKIKKIKILKNGCKQYILENPLTGECFPKTELLEEWGIKGSIDYALEVLNDENSIKKDAIQGVKLAGTTMDGHKLSVVVEEKSKDIIDLVTVWPR